jgi:hypothetical protein
MLMQNNGTNANFEISAVNQMTRHTTAVLPYVSLDPN